MAAHLGALVAPGVMILGDVYPGTPYIIFAVGSLERCTFAIFSFLTLCAGDCISVPITAGDPWRAFKGRCCRVPHQQPARLCQGARYGCHRGGGLRSERATRRLDEVMASQHGMTLVCHFNHVFDNSNIVCLCLTVSFTDARAKMDYLCSLAASIIFCSCCNAFGVSIHVYAIFTTTYALESGIVRLHLLQHALQLLIHLTARDEHTRA